MSKILDLIARLDRNGPLSSAPTNIDEAPGGKGRIGRIGRVLEVKLGYGVVIAEKGGMRQLKQKGGGTPRNAQTGQFLARKGSDSRPMVGKLAGKSVKKSGPSKTGKREDGGGDTLA